MNCSAAAAGERAASASARAAARMSPFIPWTLDPEPWTLLEVPVECKICANDMRVIPIVYSQIIGNVSRDVEGLRVDVGLLEGDPRHGVGAEAVLAAEARAQIDGRRPLLLVANVVDPLDGRRQQGAPLVLRAVIVHVLLGIGAEPQREPAPDFQVGRKVDVLIVPGR